MSERNDLRKYESSTEYWTSGFTPKISEEDFQGDIDIGVGIGKVIVSEVKGKQNKRGSLSDSRGLRPE